MADPYKSQSFDGRSYQLQPEHKYYTVAGVPDPLHHSHSCPAQLPPQDKYYAVSGTPLRHSWSCSTPISNTHNHPWPPVQGNAAPTSNKDLPMGKLFVTISKARGTKGDEWKNIGRADPYAIMRHGGKNVGGRAETLVHQDAGSDPVWNQTFPFYVKELNPEYNMFCITLYNKNRWGRKDNILGQLTLVNLGQIIRDNENKVHENWYPVYRKGKQRGEILLAFNLISMTPEQILKSPTVTSDVLAKNPDYRLVRRSHERDVIQTVLQGVGVIVAVIALFV